MYSGQISKNGTPITVAEAVALNLIVVDAQGDVWLKSDTNRSIKVTGDLKFQDNQ